MNSSKKFCRLCFKETNSSGNIFSQNLIDKNIGYKIELHLHIKITKDEELTTFVCDSCIERVEQIHVYYKQVRGVQKILCKYLNSIESYKQDSNANEKQITSLVIIKEQKPNLGAAIHSSDEENSNMIKEKNQEKNRSTSSSSNATTTNTKHHHLYFVSPSSPATAVVKQKVDNKKLSRTVKKRPKPTNRKCAVPGCGFIKKHDPNIRLYLFPLTDERRRREWFDACGLKYNTKKSLTICGQHFDLHYDRQQKLDPFAKPTRFLPPRVTPTSVTQVTNDENVKELSNKSEEIKKTFSIIDSRQDKKNQEAIHSEENSNNPKIKQENDSNLSEYFHSATERNPNFILPVVKQEIDDNELNIMGCVEDDKINFNLLEESPSSVPKICTSADDPLSMLTIKAEDTTIIESQYDDF